MQRVFPTGLYQHYKGDLYNVLTVGENIDEETMEPLVSYTRSDGSDPRKFSRRLSVFTEQVVVTDTVTQTVRVLPRFTFLGFTLNVNGIIQQLINTLVNAKALEYLEVVPEGSDIPPAETVEYSFELVLTPESKVQIHNGILIPRRATDKGPIAVDLGTLGAYTVTIGQDMSRLDVVVPEGEPHLPAHTIHAQMVRRPQTPADSHMYHIEVPEGVTREDLDRVIAEFMNRRAGEANEFPNQGEKAMDAKVEVAEPAEPDTLPSETEEAAGDERFAFGEGQDEAPSLNTPTQAVPDQSSQQ